MSPFRFHASSCAVARARVRRRGGTSTGREDAFSSTSLLRDRVGRNARASSFVVVEREENPGCNGVTESERASESSSGTDGTRVNGVNRSDPRLVSSRLASCPTPARTLVRTALSTRRPQSRRDHPLNLSILLSGGKETNQDFLSSGERTGRSPAPNPAVPPQGNVVFGRVRLSRGVASRPSPS